MSQIARSHIEPLCAAAFGLPVARSHAPDSRTVLRQRLVNTVLPGLALLSMSVLTVAMIVILVTTVAHGGWLTPGTYVTVDPWANVYPGPANLRRDDIMYPDAATSQGPQESDPSFDAQARSTASAGYIAGSVAE